MTEETIKQIADRQRADEVKPKTQVEKWREEKKGQLDIKEEVKKLSEDVSKFGKIEGDDLIIDDGIQKQKIGEIKGEKEVEKDERGGEVETCFKKLDDDRMIEQVLDPETKLSQFAIYNNETKKVKYQKSIKHEGITYYPRDTNPIRNGIVLFPSKAKDYGSVAVLIDEIKEFIHKYLDVPNGEEEILAYRVLFSWVFDKFSALDYTRFLGDYQSGKSRGIDVIGHISYE